MCFFQRLKKEEELQSVFSLMTQHKPPKMKVGQKHHRQRENGADHAAI